MLFSVPILMEYWVTFFTPIVPLNGDMTLEEDGGHRNGKDVRDNMLDGVSVGGGQGHRRGPLVVLLVYALVKAARASSRTRSPE